jgi:hypothetical protein
LIRSNLLFNESISVFLVRFFLLLLGFAIGSRVAQMGLLFGCQVL